MSQFIARPKKQAQKCNFANPDVHLVNDKYRSSELRRPLLGKELLALQKVLDRWKQLTFKLRKWEQKILHLQQRNPWECTGVVKRDV